MVPVSKSIMKPVDNVDHKTRHERRGVGVPAIRVQGITETAVLVLVASQDVQYVLRISPLESVFPLCEFQRVCTAADKTVKFFEIVKR